MPVKVDFRAVQHDFAAAIRDPDHAPIPQDVDPRRLRIYQDLFYTNVASFIESAFPVTLSILGETEAEALKRRFFRNHRCSTPYFLEIAEECYRYVGANEAAVHERWPFLLELMHYEWAELAASVAEGERPEAVSAEGDLMADIPCLSPFVWPLAYQWPVHRISTEWQPTVTPAEPTYLLIYRDAEDDVRFMEINALTAWLVEQLQQQEGCSGRELLAQLAAASGQAVPTMMAAGRELLDDLRQRGVILGTKITAVS